MKEFVLGTDEQFRNLEIDITSGKKIKFEGRDLPDCCTPRKACLWFGKNGPYYDIAITEGIVTSKGSEEFKLFLKQGGASFEDMESLVGFMRSLKPLFDDEDQHTVAAPVCKGAAPASCPNGVVDKDRLKQIRMEREKQKLVRPEQIADPIKRKVVGQDAVIESIADMIVINQMRKEKKLLTITLLGPTATGKSETGKSLAEVLSDVYGRKYGFIEVAGSEFIGEHTVHRFLGAPPGYVGHGEPTLLDPVRKNPYHVIVINEIEKADDKLLVALMEAIDTGLLGMADNSEPLDLNNCVLILTSNIPIDMEEYEEADAFGKAEMCRDAFTQHCGRPEISGKIGNFLAFSPLGEGAITEIIFKFISQELESYDLTLAHVSNELIDDLVGKQTTYGARGIRGLISETVGRALIKNRQIIELKGKEIMLKGRIDDIRFEVCEDED